MRRTCTGDRAGVATVTAMWDRGTDILGDGGHRRSIPEVVAAPGLLVEVASSAFAGRITQVTPRDVEVTDRRGRRRRFELHPGAFVVDERRVTLVPPAASHGPVAVAPATTASGSIAVTDSGARTARASRIMVEGIHDAEILEQVWGDDLRYEGIVVEVLDGIDELANVVRAFGPAPRRRLGVLVDHLVPGSKEQRIAATVRHPDVLVTGHPFVDVWAAVKPAAVGIDRWPDVPRGTPWKAGVAAALGFADHHELWRRVRASVTRYTDLDRSLVGAVERLIDHVTAPGTA